MAMAKNHLFDDEQRCTYSYLSYLSSAQQIHATKVSGHTSRTAKVFKYAKKGARSACKEAQGEQQPIPKLTHS